MSKKLIIVESPAKEKTIEKYLGKDFKVLATYGHVRDLISKDGAVDPADGFSMTYQIIDRNKKHVDAIEKALKKADALYLATDPDREGEAISWHLYELLKERNALNGKSVHRVVFHEITKNAVREAIENPRDLDFNLINAQQTRRALDHLVGFNLSPLLWKKIRPKLSAGRVQSPALRLIVEREKEIDAFIPQEYWTIAAALYKDQQDFTARLTEYNGEKIEQFSITNEQQAGDADAALTTAANGQLTVLTVDKKERKRNPAPPFTTSTLQQDASRKLGFGAQRTMRAAQKLYEGLDIGDGQVGLITYMRTDSVTLANEAIDGLRATIADKYGKDQVPEQVRVFKTKSKNAQEAHEAIRPTNAQVLPEQLEGKVEDDQLRLYRLIWQRTMACQMVHAIYDTLAVDLVAETSEGPVGRFRANGSVLVQPGFLAVYHEGHETAADDQDRLLPPLAEGDVLALKEIVSDQHFTEPKPRYSEASLVKELEEYGIGRPSTYANIISTLQRREYVEIDRRRFFPTDIGKIVSDFLTNHFEQYVDYLFTANMEDDLDAISRGEKKWVPLLESFWSPFKTRVMEKEETVSRAEALKKRVLGTDPESGRELSVRMGRYGPFAQIGTREEEEKPKFAGLRKGQSLDTIGVEEALELFKLPRDLGETPEGEALSVNIGRFGPYVRYDNKFVSLKKEDDPYTIEYERALELVRDKKEYDANRLIRDFPDVGIQILNGRWGPYITDKEKNARVPKDTDPKTLTLEECQTLLAEAPVRGRRKKAAAKKTGEKKAAAKKKSKKKKARKKKAGKKKAAKKKPAPDQGDD
ncbi:MAG: DNA topoisomerase I [Gammaproteobacteria bacterium]|nr:DNA topoisomerase I [Gammaproteobacteria bacterium]